MMAPAGDNKLSGVEKAAIILMNLGEELASEVFKHMSHSEIQMIAGTIVKRDHLSSQTGRQVVGEFMTTCSSGELAIEGIEFAKNAITKALGPDKAQDIIDYLTRETGGGGGIEAIKWMDPAVLANVVRYEHPQIVALILAHLDPERAAQVLLNMPEDRVRGEVMLRVATLKNIPQAAVKDLESLLSDQALGAGGGHGNAVEGIKLAAEIMNRIDSKQEGGIMEVIEKASPDLAVKIQEKMFVFTDLLSIDDRGMQLIIKELSTDVLSIALKGSEDAMKEKFFKNMSQEYVREGRRDAQGRHRGQRPRAPVRRREVPAGDYKGRKEAGAGG
ncbi:MAG: flagellar motor switch protein FliG [Deltaproteobacteria bacterium]|nr:flagellar motor switch protein FliG [Deltaproteobacteria bacterium]